MLALRQAARVARAAAAGVSYTAPRATTAGINAHLAPGLRANDNQLENQRGYHKTTTGLVGLAVDPDSRKHLMMACHQVLRMMQEFIPEGTKYRRDTELVYQYWLNVARHHTDEAEIERIINRGQMEELLEMAKDDISVIPKMAVWKPWEVPEGHMIKFELNREDCGDKWMDLPQEYGSPDYDPTNPKTPPVIVDTTTYDIYKADEPGNLTQKIVKIEPAPKDPEDPEDTRENRKIYRIKEVEEKMHDGTVQKIEKFVECETAEERKGPLFDFDFVEQVHDMDWKPYKDFIPWEDVLADIGSKEDFKKLEGKEKEAFVKKIVEKYENYDTTVFEQDPDGKFVLDEDGKPKVKGIANENVDWRKPDFFTASDTSPAAMKDKFHRKHGDGRVHPGWPQNNGEDPEFGPIDEMDPYYGKEK